MAARSSDHQALHRRWELLLTELETRPFAEALGRARAIEDFVTNERCAGERQEQNDDRALRRYLS